MTDHNLDNLFATKIQFPISQKKKWNNEAISLELSELLLITKFGFWISNITNIKSDINLSTEKLIRLVNVWSLFYVTSEHT